MTTPDDADVRQRAERALRAGRAHEALGLYGTLLSKVEVYNAGRYESWLEGALAAYEQLGRTREAGFVLMGLRRFAEAQRHFPVAERPLEWALAASCLGRHGDAARVLSEAGHPALAAMELETAGAHAAARLEWERVLRDPRLAGLPYETALARFSLGHALLRTHDRPAAERELRATQRLLETVADDLETRGDVQRALDCYRLLQRIGRDTGSFENVAEGYVNSLRILVREDQKTRALRDYEDFLAYAVERQEWYAAATLAGEAAAYCLKVGVVYDRHYLARAAELWEATAKHNEAAGGPTDMSENALHAAIDAAATLGNDALAVRLYGALAALPLPAKKRARYLALAARGGAFASVVPAAPKFPEALRRAPADPDVARTDLVEWELDGDPTAVLARVVVNPSPIDRKYVRHALRALLIANAPGAAADDARTASELARALGRVQLYEVLRPLERLYDHAAPEVRAAVMTGVGRVLTSRSFNLVRRGLADPSPVVVDEALVALRGLWFRDGFDSLSRMFRDATAERVRVAALEAMANIGTLEVGLFLLDVLRHEAGAVRVVAEARLGTFPDDELLPLVRQAIEVETGERRAALQRIVVELTAPVARGG
jgi:tetratricopeptide (TPR) repeat protein